MQLINDKSELKQSGEEEVNSIDFTQTDETPETGTEDTDPPLDEEDLEENDLTVEEADQVVWDEPANGSAGLEEKDITD